MILEPCREKKLNIDRFIPNRLPHCSSQTYRLNQISIQQEKCQNYEKYLTKQMFAQQYNEQTHLFGGQEKYQNHNDIRSLFRRKEFNHIKQSHRSINLSPQKILDAPEIKDDYYLNLLDWSSKGLLAIGLNNKVYLYSPSHISQLCQKDDQYICSVGYHPQGNLLGVGISNGKTQVYDVQTQTLIRTLKGHSSRVSSLSFTYGNIFTGSRDSQIIGHDFRAHHNITMKLHGHKGQICGLKHDACGLASGSNDNFAMIWDLSVNKLRYQLQGHKAAVKALAWCPWQRNLLVTGGGSSDKTMRFWNIQSGKQINYINTESQVCSLLWNKNDKQLVSSHGYSQNQLAIWKFPECSKIVQLHGHTQRVLHMVVSPDNSTVCTASADQTLRFWKIFQNSTKHEKQNKSAKKLNPHNFTLR